MGFLTKRGSPLRGALTVSWGSGFAEPKPPAGAQYTAAYRPRCSRFAAALAQRSEQVPEVRWPGSVMIFLWKFYDQTREFPPKKVKENLKKVKEKCIKKVKIKYTRKKLRKTGKKLRKNNYPNRKLIRLLALLSIAIIKEPVKRLTKEIHWKSVFRCNTQPFLIESRSAVFWKSWTFAQNEETIVVISKPFKFECFRCSTQIFTCFVKQNDRKFEIFRKFFIF